MSMSASVLIVEDEKDLLDAYELILTVAGFEVFTASNGKEALQRVQQKNLDLILLDLYMPIMGGREFLRAFNRDEHPHTKIVVYTNMADSTTEAEIAKLDPERMVLKSSISPDELIDLVKEMTS